MLTPGPLTTTESTRKAMLMDWGSWDSDLAAVAREVCDRLVDIAAPRRDDLRCVPIQVSGTCAVEAAVRTHVRPGGSVVVMVGCAYGCRLAEICRRRGRHPIVYETADVVGAPPAAVRS